MTKNKKLAKFIDSALFKTSPIHGTSYIEHKVRIALGLSNDEYILAGLIEKLEALDKEFTYDRIYNHIGMDKETCDKCGITLKEKGMIKIDKENNRLVVTPSWISAHKSQEDENFEKFYEQAYGKSWPGSKPQAREAYNITVAKVGHEYLMAQKLAYFKFLAVPENAWRQTMQAVEFLNSRSERYAEDWTAYYNDLPSVKKSEPATNDTLVASDMTMEKKRKLYNHE